MKKFISLIIGIAIISNFKFLILNFVNADDFIPAEEEVTSSNTFILDADDTGGDIQLQFGTTLSEYLRWDNANSIFNFSNSLQLDGTNITLDADNTGTGADTDIVSEQGSDPDGTLRYSATNNQWEISNNGGSFDPIVSGSTASMIGSFYDSTGGTDINVATPVAIPWNQETKKDTGITHSNSTNNTRVYLDNQDWYRATYSISHEDQSGNRKNIRCRIRLNGSSYIIPSDSYSYSRNTTDEWATNNATVIFQTTSDNTYYEIMCNGEGSEIGTASANTVINQSWTSVEKASALKGDKGDVGNSGTNGVDGADGDITWEGTWISQNYTTNQAVNYNGSTYVCKLNTTSSQIPTDTTYWDLMASKGDQGPSGSAGGGTNSETFVLDVDDTGGNVELQFGTTLAEYIMWDNTNSEFDLSDDLNLEGYVDFGDYASDPTTDEGRMWFRSDTDNLMLYADGRLQEVGMIEIGQFYDSDGDGGSFNVNSTTWVAIPWDSESFAEDATYSHETVTNNSRVTVNDDGVYKISYNINHEESSNNRKNVRCSVRINGSTFPIVSADSFSYVRNTTDEWGTNNASAMFVLSAGDYYEVVCRAEGTTGNSFLTAGSAEGVSWTTIELLRRE